MAGGTVAAHIDAITRQRLLDAASAEHRSPSQIVAMAVKTMLDLSPSARRALFAIEGTASEAERAYAMKVLGRSALKAHERLLDSRNADPVRHGAANAPIDSEAAADAEAIRLTK